MNANARETALAVITGVVTACSVLHSILPPWETLDGFPKIQRYYRAVVYVIGFIALNARSTVHPSISTKNGTMMSAAAAKSFQKGEK